MSKSMIIKLTVTLLAIVGLFIAFRLINEPGGAESDGTIRFVLKDEQDQIVIDDRIEFNAKKEDGTHVTFFELLNENYDLACRNASTGELDENCGEASNATGGKVILKVEDVETDFVRNYFAIFKNGEYAVQGVSQLQFENGDTIEIRVVRLS